MTLKYTKEKLDILEKEMIILLFLSLQEPPKNIDRILQLIIRQIPELKRHRYGRFSI